MLLPPGGADPPRRESPAQGPFRPSRHHLNYRPGLPVTWGAVTRGGGGRDRDRGSGALSRRVTLALPGLVVSGLLCLSAPAQGQTDPVGDAEATVAQARAEADRAAGSYLELLTRSETLDAEMAATEQQLTELAARAEKLRATVQGRAADAYLRVGSADVEFGLGSDEQAMEVARRTALLNRLNETDNEAAQQLADLTDSLQAKRAKLQADRAAYE